MDSRKEDSLGFPRGLSNCVKEKNLGKYRCTMRVKISHVSELNFAGTRRWVTGNPNTDNNTVTSVWRKSTKHSKSKSSVSVLMPLCRPGPLPHDSPMILLKTWPSNTVETVPSLHFFFYPRLLQQWRSDQMEGCRCSSSTWRVHATLTLPNDADGYIFFFFFLNRCIYFL